MSPVEPGDSVKVGHTWKCEERIAELEAALREVEKALKEECWDYEKAGDCDACQAIAAIRKVLGEK